MAKRPDLFGSVDDHAVGVAVFSDVLCDFSCGTSRSLPFVSVSLAGCNVRQLVHLSSLFVGRGSVFTCFSFTFAVIFVHFFHVCYWRC